MVSPLYDGFTLETKYYFIPYRLYIADLRKNRNLAWNTIPNLRLPGMQISFDDTNEIGDRKGAPISLAGSLLERLKISYGEFLTGQSFNNPRPMNIRETQNARTQCDWPNILPLLGYIDSWLYGEFNPMERDIPVDVDTLYLADSASSPNAATMGGRIYSSTFVNYDNLVQFIEAFAYGGSQDIPFNNSLFYWDKETNVIRGTLKPTDDLQIIKGFPLLSRLLPPQNGANPLSVFDSLSGVWSSLRNTTSNVGLLPVTYRGDYFTSWFNDEIIANLDTFVVENGETLLSLRRKNSDMLLDLIGNISGQRWVDYALYVFDEHLEFADHPILLGSDRYSFGSIDILARSETPGASNAPGSRETLGGAGSKAGEYDQKFDKFKVKTKEPGIVMITSKLLPSVVYYQGIPRSLFYEKVSDLWHPNYQKQGFQDTLRGELFNSLVAPSVSAGGYQLYLGDTTALNQSSVNYLSLGKVPIGYEYMKRVSTLSGGMITPQFSTWNLRRDITRKNGYEVIGEPNAATPNDFYFDPLLEEDRDGLVSTYIQGSLYNDSFVNYSRAEGNNFIVKYTFDCSVYQPLVHQLLDKK